MGTGSWITKNIRYFAAFSKEKSTETADYSLMMILQEKKCSRLEISENSLLKKVVKIFLRTITSITTRNKIVNILRTDITTIKSTNYITITLQIINKICKIMVLTTFLTPKERKSYKTSKQAYKTLVCI